MTGWRYDGGDPSIKLFDRAVHAWPMDLPYAARVLELGCAETDFHARLLTLRPDLRLTGVDVNDVPGYTGTFIRGAAEQQHFPEASFEAVILLGSLEHFGLGFYGDPECLDADMSVVRRATQWLVPGGWLYYDVPWTPQSGHITENRHFRVYDDTQIRTRLTGGLRPVARMYAHGQTDVAQPTRPESPTSPFWYLQRLLVKDA